MARTMKAMEKLVELEAERIKGLEGRLQGQEKEEYGKMKADVERRNKRTWREAQAVGAVGLLTIASGLYFAVKGSSKTEKNLDGRIVSQEDNQDSFQIYRESRSPFLDYAWLGIIAGNTVCAAGYITGQHIIAKRSKPLRDYLESLQ